MLLENLITLRKPKWKSNETWIMLVYISISHSTTLNNKNLRKGVGKTKQSKKNERNPNQIKIKTASDNERNYFFCNNWKKREWEKHFVKN